MDNSAVDRLILRIAQNDMAALEELYNGMSQSVFAFVMVMVKNPAVAEDVMQDTFVRLYYGAARFMANGFGKAWIMRIARNLALNALTRGVVTEEPELAESPSSENTEDNAITNVMLAQAMQKLSDDERQVLTLHAVAGMKLQEIASALDEPLGTIKWRHASALKKVRKYIGEGDV